MQVDKNIKKLIYLLIALFYAFMLSLIPEIFLRDRDAYYVYAIEPDIIFNRYLNDGILKAITNEPLFLGINYILKIFIDPEYIASSISFFISFILIFFLMKEVKGLWLKLMAILLVTFVPLLFHFQLIILRQSLATIIFIIIVTLTNKPKNWIIGAFILTFVHSSFGLVSVLMLVLYIIKDYKYVYQIIIITGFSILLASTIFIIGNFIGARQTADIYDVDTFTPSGLSFMMYSILLVLLLTRSDEFLKSYKYSSIAIIGLTSYLAMYFISPIAGRLINIFLPFILCVLLKTTKSISYVFIIIYFIANLLTFKNAVILGSLTEEFSLFSNSFL